MDITRNAIWTQDCQGKQDLDFSIIHAFTRYYPDYSAICSIVFCPDEAGEGTALCESDIMYGHSESEIKQIVREWYNAHIQDAFKKAIEEVGIGMEKYDEEYLNSKIEAYGKAHPNGNKEDLELLAEMRGYDTVDLGNGITIHKDAYDIILKKARDCVKQCWVMRDSFAHDDEEFVEYFMKLMEE